MGVQQRLQKAAAIYKRAGGDQGSGGWLIPTGAAAIGGAAGYTLPQLFLDKPSTKLKLLSALTGAALLGGGTYALNDPNLAGPGAIQRAADWASGTWQGLGTSILGVGAGGSQLNAARLRTKRLNQIMGMLRNAKDLGAISVNDAIRIKNQLAKATSGSIKDMYHALGKGWTTTPATASNIAAAALRLQPRVRPVGGIRGAIRSLYTGNIRRLHF